MVVEVRTAQQFVDTLRNMNQGTIDSGTISILNDLDFEEEGIGYRTSGFSLTGHTSNDTIIIEGNGHTIRNITFETNRCFYEDNYYSSSGIQNLKIENLFLRPTDPNMGNYLFGSINGPFYLKNVSISAAQVEMDKNSTMQIYLFDISNVSSYVVNCSFYFKNFIFKDESFRIPNCVKTNILIEDSLLNTSFINVFDSNYQMNNVGIIFKNCKARASSIQICNYNTSSNYFHDNYIVFEDSFIGIGSENYFQIYLYPNGSKNNNNILSYNDEVFEVPVNFYQFTGTKLSKAQMQSKEYLQQIGWLP